MLEEVFKRALRAVFGAGSDISAANPLETHAKRASQFF